MCQGKWLFHLFRRDQWCSFVECRFYFLGNREGWLCVWQSASLDSYVQQLDEVNGFLAGQFHSNVFVVHLETLVLVETFSTFGTHGSGSVTTGGDYDIGFGAVGRFDKKAFDEPREGGHRIRRSSEL